MNETPAVLRPETLALDALIREIVARVEASEGEGTPDRMVFLGNRHHSFPAAVVEDRVLEPVDKVVWMVIMLAVRETGGDTTFPGYDAIGRMANVASRSTIARAIAILRATRWLSLCARVRRASGRFHGNVYALHDEPLPLADAVHLDTGYMTFLGSATGHGHARVRVVAQGVLDSIDEDIRTGRAICAPTHPIERRLESRVTRDDSHPRRFFAFTRQVVWQLHAKSREHPPRPVCRDQKSNVAIGRNRNSSVQKSNSGSCSSDIDETTTTHTPVSSKFVVTGEGEQPVVYPARLCDNHRETAARYLGVLAPEQRQPILDELEGRFRAEAKGMKPVYDEISFLHALCKRARQGKFQPNLGIKVRKGRRARERPGCNEPGRQRARSANERDEGRQQRKADSQAHLAGLRKLLGMSEGTEKQ